MKEINLSSDEVSSLIAARDLYTLPQQFYDDHKGQHIAVSHDRLGSHTHVFDSSQAYADHLSSLNPTQRRSFSAPLYIPTDQEGKEFWPGFI